MKYHILTLGCQMNKSDSERIARVLENLDYKKANDEKSADLIVINSCSVRQSAIDRIYGKTRIWNQEKIRRQKEDERPLITILTGCVLPDDKKKLEKLFDLVLDIKNLSELPERLVGFPLTPPNPPYQGGDERFPPDRGGWGGKKDYFSIKPIYQNPWSAYVPIMTGCNNFCSYCAVPHTRGREASRSVKEILDEVKNLADNGCLEITLLGQNVNTYRPEDKQSYSQNNPYKDPFAALLWEINQITPLSLSYPVRDKLLSRGLNRIHFTAPHPKDMRDEVIDALALPKMVNFLHLPVQSGDDEILRKMNRHYTAEDYLELIKKIKQKKPNMAIGTDIIVGFPGETKEQFESTVKLYKEVQFDISYTAKYSPRPGTAAARLKDTVSLREKKRRWQVLQKLMEEITLEKNQQYVGQEVEVLVDKVCGNPISTKEIRFPQIYEGNSREYKRVRFSSKKDLLGKVVKVKINKAMEWMLEGEVQKTKKQHF
jgi:tRNA-2-methylthio-N6-dimethylallyladenosine synthase